MGLIGHASDESPERKGVCEEIFTLQVKILHELMPGPNYKK